MSDESCRQPVELDVQEPIWNRCYIVAPLVLIGTREPGGRDDLAPKHMVTPLGWGNWFGFVCTPAHRTYRNVRRERAFTVSFPRPDQVVLASLAASPRCEDADKHILEGLPVSPAQKVDGVLLDGAHLQLECELGRIVDGFDENELITGRIVAARCADDALRVSDEDGQQLVARAPLLAYLAPDRYARVAASTTFPFPHGFSR
jgi:flavin reductase (DIM6/NTAB) family NADH-FMN oxidoreductase RutF